MEATLFRFIRFRRRGKRADAARGKPSPNPEAYSDALLAGWVPPPPAGEAHAEAAGDAAAATEDGTALVERFYRNQQ